MQTDIILDECQHLDHIFSVQKTIARKYIMSSAEESSKQCVWLQSVLELPLLRCDSEGLRADYYMSQ